MGKSDFKVIIAGTRDFADYELLKSKCDYILRQKVADNNIVVISGTARGADRLGERYARERGFLIQKFPADWDRDGNAAGPIRNAKMADNADALIAFWDGKSRGTANMIETAKSRGLMVRVVNIRQQYLNKHNEDPQIIKLRNETSQYAIEHITHKGMHTGIAWLRDSFNELCEATGANRNFPTDTAFRGRELMIFLRSEPWVGEIAAKSEDQRTSEDVKKIVEDFICKHWCMAPEQVTSKDVSDILKMADPLNKRHIIAQRVAIDCAHALNEEQLEQLDKVLKELEVSLDLEISKGIKL